MSKKNEAPCKTGSQCTSKCQQCEQPAQQQESKRWAVFCSECRKEWSVSYPHPGKSICAECDAKAGAQQQEPVAWMDDYNECKCPDNEARCFSDKVFRMMQKHSTSLVKQQEPVAKICPDLPGGIGWNPNLTQLPDEGTPLYTSPQSKPWVGLTDEEQNQVAWSCGAMSADWLDFARAIESKLREKNL